MSSLTSKASANAYIFALFHISQSYGKMSEHHLFPVSFCNVVLSLCISQIVIVSETSSLPVLLVSPVFELHPHIHSTSSHIPSISATYSLPSAESDTQVFVDLERRVSRYAHNEKRISIFDCAAESYAKRLGRIRGHYVLLWRW